MKNDTATGFLAMDAISVPDRKDEIEPSRPDDTEGVEGKIDEPVSETVEGESGDSASETGPVESNPGREAISNPGPASQQESSATAAPWEPARATRAIIETLSRVYPICYSVDPDPDGAWDARIAKAHRFATETSDLGPLRQVLAEWEADVWGRVSKASSQIKAAVSRWPEPRRLGFQFACEELMDTSTPEYSFQTAHAVLQAVWAIMGSDALWEPPDGEKYRVAERYAAQVAYWEQPARENYWRLVRLHLVNDREDTLAAACERAFRDYDAARKENPGQFPNPTEGEARRKKMLQPSQAASQVSIDDSIQDEASGSGTQSAA